MHFLNGFKALLEGKFHPQMGADAFQLVPGLDVTGEVFSIIIISLYSAIAAAGGIGGGTINVSVLIAFGAKTHTAVPMSKIIILGGSFILMLINVGQKSKLDPAKPAVMWDLVFFIENAVIMGAIAGSFLNALLPEWFILSSELLFFLYEGVNSTIKGVKGVKKDREKFKGLQDVTFDQVILAEQNATKKEEEKPLLQNGETPTGGEKLVSDSSEVTLPTVVQDKKCGHWKFVNKIRLCNFVGALILSTIFTICRAFVSKCGVWYWVLVGLNFVIGFIAVGINTVSMHHSYKTNDGTILTGATGDAFDSPKAMAKFSIIGFLAGAFASALGIGGGLIKTPLMLSMGIPPYVSRLASSTMIAFTALTSTVQYLVLGQIKLNQAWIFLLSVMVLYPLGYFLSEPLIKIIRSTSVIQLAIAAGLVISSIFVAINTVSEYIKIVDTGILPGINDICE